VCVDECKYVTYFKMATCVCACACVGVVFRVRDRFGCIDSTSEGAGSWFASPSVLPQISEQRLHELLRYMNISICKCMNIYIHIST